MSLRANVDPSSKRRTTRYCDCCDVDVDVDVDTDSAISSASSKRNTVYRARTSTIEPSLSRRCCAMLSAVVVSNNVVNSCTRRRDAALVLVMIVFNIFYFHYSSLFFSVLLPSQSFVDFTSCLLDRFENARQSTEFVVRVIVQFVHDRRSYTSTSGRIQRSQCQSILT